MKITMYELLGMVKDGKAPKRIIYDEYVYEFNEDTKDYIIFKQYCKVGE